MGQAEDAQRQLQVSLLRRRHHPGDTMLAVKPKATSTGTLAGRSYPDTISNDISPRHQECAGSFSSLGSSSSKIRTPFQTTNPF